MRYSDMFLPTTREVPADAEIVSHQLMIRSGMIRKLTSGIYAYLPLGYRVIRKVEQIIREEMNAAGAQEVFMPAVQPAELWQESGRWYYYGKELLRLKDRHNRECCIGPTHEEVITSLVRDEIQTYRQLPKNLYQIQTKFRDEIRPRFGVMRAREFGMKDAYSFDADEEGANESYGKMFAAYQRIFSRCGLTFRAVEADSGNIGGSYSHEFLVTAESGEDAMVYCSACDYAANREKAEIPKPVEAETPEEERDAEEIYTPDVRTIEEVSDFLKVTPDRIVKTLIFVADDTPVAALVRGDHDINEIKLKNCLRADTLELASDAVIQDVTNSPRGFAGPRGITARVIADYSIMNMRNCVIGANKENYHMVNCNNGRDFTIAEFADVRFVTEGDVCPRCGGPISFARGIEVGHVFKLGTKYSQTMNATYLDRNGTEKHMIMGCYGIGVGRTVAACIEQSFDDDGIIWPMALAPFQVIITPVNMNEESLAEAAEDIYGKLTAAGVEVLMDDRDERAGVKFKDADLIGIPLRITIGKKSLAAGAVELRNRKTQATENIQLTDVVSTVQDVIHREIAAG